MCAPSLGNPVVDKVDALRLELTTIKLYIDPEVVNGPVAFLQQFKDALMRAENFVKVLYPPPLP